MWCTTGNGFGREGKIKRKRIGKTRQREDEGGNGGEKMENEIPKKVPKDGAKGQVGSKKSSIYVGSKQIYLMRGNDLATDFPYSMNEITL